MVTGQTIGHYRILRLLGKGGMGEVYLAEDTQLQRHVALKFLPESVRNDPDGLARFRREALTAASLKHPNIAVIYAIEEALQDGQDNDHGRAVRAKHAAHGDVRAKHAAHASPLLFIAMEYIDGQPLADLIPPGGMALDDARDGAAPDVRAKHAAHGHDVRAKHAAHASPPTFFAIFLPLADALAHAHEHGIAHRDLKPGNIMIDRDGAPKLLDFGIARIIHETPQIGPEDTTATMKSEDHQKAMAAAMASLTREPQFMGTLRYMSPEQVERDKVDQRSDLFSFGVVMYEALTGQRPFDGKSPESVIGKIMEAEPEPATALRPATPYPLWWTIRKCLEKDREQRIQTARELHADLLRVQQAVQEGAALVDARTIPRPAPVPLWRQPLTMGLAAATLLIGLAAAWFLKPVPPIPEPPLRRFTLTVDPMFHQNYDGPAVSPDGRMIAYGQNRKLWIRDLDIVTPRELPDTQYPMCPFWSPGSDFVAYFVQGPRSTLYKIAASGGPSIPLCDLPVFPRGGVWRPDGTIVVGMADQFNNDLNGALYMVSDQGGEPVVIATADSSQDQRGLIHTALLPDGSLLYAATVGEEAGALVAQTGQHHRVILPSRGERVAFPVYSPTGHIIYQRGFPDSKGVWAVGFDATSLQVTGEPFPVDAQGGYPTVSSDGTLVYRSGEVAFPAPPKRLAWVDRQGRVEPMGEARDGLRDQALSPDGRLVAFCAVSQRNHDIWVYDLERDTATRLTSDPGFDEIPNFSPDGRWVAFESDRSGDGDIYVRAADGSGNEALLVGGPGVHIPTSWSWEGRRLIYHFPDNTGSDLWYATLQAENGALKLDGPPQSFLRSEFNEEFGRLSPDGRYLAYMSDESGRYEVYVRSFPDGGSRRQVSPDGGSHPRWSPMGGELFYVADEGEGNGPMMAVSVETVGEFRRGRPRKLFDAPAGVSLYLFDVSSDGQRFLAVQAAGGEVQGQTTITVVQNWAKAFEGRK